MVRTKILSLAFTSLNLYLSVVCQIHSVTAWRVGHSHDACLKRNPLGVFVLSKFAYEIKYTSKFVISVA